MKHELAIKQTAIQLKRSINTVRRVLGDFEKYGEIKTPTTGHIGAGSEKRREKMGLSPPNLAALNLFIARKNANEGGVTVRQICDFLATEQKVVIGKQKMTRLLHRIGYVFGRSKRGFIPTVEQKQKRLERIRLFLVMFSQAITQCDVFGDVGPM